MSAAGAVQADRCVAAKVLLRWYEVSLKPGVVHEKYFDKRAELIMGTVKLLQEEFAQILPEAVEEIVMDVSSLMPSDEQIAGSRRSSSERFMQLKPNLFEPIPLASA